MAKHQKTALKTKLTPTLVILLIATGGCSNQMVQTPAPQKSLEVTGYSNQSYEQHLHAILTQAKTRQALLHFATEKRDFQTDQWVEHGVNYHIDSTATSELTKSWNLLDRALYTLAKKELKLQAGSTSTADSKHISSFIIAQQDALITSAFTSYFYTSATKQLFSQRQQLIKHSLNKLHRLPQTAENAHIFLDIEKRASDLDRLYQTVTADNHSFSRVINNHHTTPNMLTAHFSSEIPSPDDLIMNHARLIRQALSRVRKKAPPSYEQRADDLNRNESTWTITFPHYPYLLPTKKPYDAPAAEAWELESKELIKKLEQLERIAPTEKKTTPRGINYEKKYERKNTQREQLFELMILARLRVALLDYALHYELFKTAKRKAKLQKQLTPQLNITSPLDLNMLLNNIQLSVLDIQTHLAYSQLLTSLIRINSSTGIHSQASYIAHTDGLNNDATQQSITTSKSSTKNLPTSDFKHIFVSTNLSDLASAKKHDKLKNLEPHQTAFRPATKANKVETLSTLRPDKPFDKPVIGNSDLYGIRLLYAKSHEEFSAHRVYSGLRDLPYRTELKGYDVHYSVYYNTYPSQKAALQGLKEIPPFYQLFKPVITKLPN